MLNQVLLKQMPPILVFCKDPLKTQGLLKLKIPNAVLFEDLCLEKKKEILLNFEKQKIWCLFASDCVARGVDFKGV